MRKMLEALAGVSAEGRMSFDQLLVTEGVRLNRNDMILAVTADPDPAWVRALREIRRRGVQSVAVVMDGSTFGGQESLPGVVPRVGAVEHSFLQGAAGG